MTGPGQGDRGEGSGWRLGEDPGAEADRFALFGQRTRCFVTRADRLISGFGEITLESTPAHRSASLGERAGAREARADRRVAALRNIDLPEVVPTPADGLPFFGECTRVAVAVAHGDVATGSGIGPRNLVLDAPPAHSFACVRERTGMGVTHADRDVAASLIEGGWVHQPPNPVVSPHNALNAMCSASGRAGLRESTDELDADCQCRVAAGATGVPILAARSASCRERADGEQEDVSSGVVPRNAFNGLPDAAVDVEPAPTHKVTLDRRGARRQVAHNVTRFICDELPEADRRVASGRQYRQREPTRAPADRLAGLRQRAGMGIGHADGDIPARRGLLWQYSPVQLRALPTRDLPRIRNAACASAFGSDEGVRTWWGVPLRAALNAPADGLAGPRQRAGVASAHGDGGVGARRRVERGGGQRFVRGRGRHGRRSLHGRRSRCSRRGRCRRGRRGCRCGRSGRGSCRRGWRGARGGCSSRRRRRCRRSGCRRRGGRCRRRGRRRLLPRAGARRQRQREAGSEQHRGRVEHPHEHPPRQFRRWRGARGSRRQPGARTGGAARTRRREWGRGPRGWTRAGSAPGGASAPGG